MHLILKYIYRREELTMWNSLLGFSSILALLPFAFTLPALDSNALTPFQDFNPNCLHGARHTIVTGNTQCLSGELGTELHQYGRAMLCEYPEKFSEVRITCGVPCTRIVFNGKWTADVQVCKINGT